MQLFFLNVYYVLQYCDEMEKKAGDQETGC